MCARGDHPPYDEPRKPDFLIEAWDRSITCIAFRRVARLSTAIRQAQHYVADLRPDRVYIRSGRDEVAAWQATGGWRARTPEIAAALDGDE